MTRKVQVTSQKMMHPINSPELIADPSPMMFLRFAILGVRA